jgi:hypothetical protein
MKNKRTLIKEAQAKLMATDKALERLGLTLYCPVLFHLYEAARTSQGALGSRLLDFVLPVLSS